MKKVNTGHVNISTSEKIELVMNLSTMISAGISILSAVDSLLEDAKGNQKIVLQALNDDINQGKHIYSAFARFPQIFDKVTINIVKAAEEAGTLDVVLKDIKNNIRKDMEFSDKIRSALMYPILIMIVFVGVLLMILIVVIPKISIVFLRLKVALPLPTKILIFASDLLVNQPIPLLIGAAIIVGSFIMLYKNQRQVILQFFYSLPIISPLMRKIDLTRFTYNLYLLLNSGIPITSALELAQDVVLKKEVAVIIEQSRKMVLSGKNLSEGLKTGKGIIPNIMIKLIEAGERSGSLEKSLHEVSDFLEYEVASMLKTATALLEPVMLVVVGVLVGGMMMSIIAPIYGLISTVSSH
ncbi:hypothetical protein COY90_00465 [Candidatus Roizmanbacteria bacterium CG_4_10_14_0_8_um_filter_39_9]|uniref:Type II secretion system protein GspF domain-containing protein n=1 Tax=Candidatus Roizmanbacteria bacterium CG_4_10_14_0_8_um_filter_39_9 TaxID=1974829 RepID=A0A2M7QE24_9BACT|nr:MAG: hypothetical protein COY90_00465 [Candidatus Roizmanbacteria bacterium CG_4_10_14_0_8_um_filter_39_9]